MGLKVEISIEDQSHKLRSTQESSARLIEPIGLNQERFSFHICRAVLHIRIAVRGRHRIQYYPVGMFIVADVAISLMDTAFTLGDFGRTA